MRNIIRHRADKLYSSSLYLSQPPKRPKGHRTADLAVGRRAVQPAFTIVELLIVIVVIAILAAISIVSYTGIQNQARSTALLSDASQAATQLKLFQASNGKYPATVSTDCTASPDSATNKCLKLSSDNKVKSYSSPSPNNTFSLTITDASAKMSFVVTERDEPTQLAASTTTGGQSWLTANLNVGTMVSMGTAQTDNGIVEKYCYNNDESNCTTYGALYQWGEAMQYSTAAGARGICPAGTHIPTDNEWKTLEISLGMTQAQADAIGWRGTDQGTQLKPGGSSGFNVPLAGRRSPAGAFFNLGTSAFVWSSSESGSSAWRRGLYSGYATVGRHTDDKAGGFSVRCLEN